MNTTVELFIKLASIYSPSGKEAQIVEFVKEYMKPLVDYLYVDHVGNIYARKNGTGDKSLLLCAHLDTVEPAGAKKPVVRNKVITSGGAFVLGADDKSAVAAILSTLKALHRDRQTHKNIEVLFTVREETDGGIRDFDRSKIRSKKALLSDLARPIGTIITAAPYVGGYEVHARAPGNHVGLTEKDTVHPLYLLHEYIKHMKFGRNSEDTVTNIAKVHMGESFNTVPQLLHFTGEIRTFNKRRYIAFPKTVQRVLAVGDKKIRTKSTMKFYHYCNGYVLSKHDIADTIRVLAKLRIRPIPKNVFSVGDFNVLSEWGVIPVNIGTGGKDAHTTYESISIKALQQLHEIFTVSVL